MIAVTGASRGLGRAIAERLHSQGHEVIGIARTGTAAPFKIYEGDVADFDTLKSVARELKSTGQTLSGLINAAGVASMNLALATPPAVSRKIIETNLLGTIFASQCFLPLIIRNGGGSIINFSTIAVSLALKGEAIYAASKAGVETFSRTLAREIAPFSINVNCIAPGPIPTEMLAGVNREKIEELVKHQVIQKQFLPEDVANLVELMLDSRFYGVSGQVISLGGS